MRTFTELLDHHIRRLGLPISEVSRQARIPKQTLYRWLNGSKPRKGIHLASEMERLVKALGLEEAEAHELKEAAMGKQESGTGEETRGNPRTSKTTEPPQHMLPHGWFAAGHSPKAYDMGAQAGDGDAGREAFLQSRPNPPGFGTLMQQFSARQYLGKRIRFSAEVMSIGLTEWAGLWMRVDDDKRDSPSFDNMQDRAIRGTTEWIPCHIVLDVPDNAVLIALGILLSGEGNVRMRRLRFETVGRDVPTTGRWSRDDDGPDQPQNLELL